jgi:hypothetical protein
VDASTRHFLCLRKEIAAHGVPLISTLCVKVKHNEIARATIRNNQSNNAIFAPVTSSRPLQWQSNADHVQWPKEWEKVHYACQIHPERSDG